MSLAVGTTGTHGAHYVDGTGIAGTVCQRLHVDFPDFDFTNSLTIVGTAAVIVDALHVIKLDHDKLDKLDADDHPKLLPTSGARPMDPGYGPVLDQDVATRAFVEDAAPPGTIFPSGAVTSETAFGQAPSAGSSDDYSRGNHTHGTPTDPVPAHDGQVSPHATATSVGGKAIPTGGFADATTLSGHTSAAAPHSGHEATVNKEWPSGYAALDGTTRVPAAQLGSGEPIGSKFLRDDRTWSVVPEVGGVFTEVEKLALEMEMAFKTAWLADYKEMAYDVDGNLVDVDVWQTPARLVKLFHKDLTYGAGDLTRIVLSRISDGVTLTKDFSYTGGNLASVTRTVA